MARWRTAAYVGTLGLAPSCPSKAAALQANLVALPSTFPWGDRRDLHPLSRGSRPRASTTSASITVRLEGIAPSPIAYPQDTLAVGDFRSLLRRTESIVPAARSSGDCTTVVLQAEPPRRLGNWICTNGLEVPNPALCSLSYTQKTMPCHMAGDDPAVVTPHGGPDRSGDRSRRSTSPANRTLLSAFGLRSRPRRQRRSTTGRSRTLAAEFAPPRPVLETVARIGRSRRSRTFSRTGMSRGGARHGLRKTGEISSY